MGEQGAEAKERFVLKENESMSVVEQGGNLIRLRRQIRKSIVPIFGASVLSAVTFFKEPQLLSAASAATKTHTEQKEVAAGNNNVEAVKGSVYRGVKSQDKGEGRELKRSIVRSNPHVETGDNRLEGLIPKLKKIYDLFGAYTPDRFFHSEGFGRRQALQENHKAKTLTTSKIEGKVGTAQLERAVLSPLTVEQIVKKTYPPTWVDDVTRIAQIEADFTGEVPIKDGIVIAEAFSDTGEIIFYKASKDYPLTYLINDRLSHELAHLKGWEDNEINIVEAADLLLAVNERVQSPDRFESSYIEAIENNDEFKNIQKKDYKLALEYWAEIAEAYLSCSGDLNAKDYELVDNFVRRDNPNFNVAQGCSERNARIIMAN